MPLLFFFFATITSPIIGKEECILETLGKIIKWIFVTLVVVVIGGLIWSIVKSIIGLFRK